MQEKCSHFSTLKTVTTSAQGCEECLKIGGIWVNLRICLICGKVGCCDSSPNKHATKHVHEVGHPIIQSFQPDETWVYCYEDEVTLDPAEKIYKVEAE